MKSYQLKRGLTALGALALAVAAVAEVEGPKFSGFVDFGYNYNFNGLNNNTYRAFDGKANTLTLQNAELVMQGTGAGEVGYRIDVDYGQDPSVVSSFDGFGDDQLNLQQAFIAIPCPWTQGTFTVGKFVTPFGAEVIESKDNYNTSRGLLFTNAIPLVHTGLKYDKGFMDGKLSVTGGLVNGWDVSRDNNKGKSFFAQTAINVFPRIGIVLGGMYGPESASSAFVTPGTPTTEKNGRGLVDAILKVTPFDKLTLLANADWGVEEGAPLEPTASDDTTANWTGVALFANYDFTEMYSAAVRYENFDDEGSRLTPTAPIHQTVNSITVTLQKKWNSLIGRVEYRTDSSTDKVYMKDDGTADDSESTIGANLVYSF